MNAKNWMWQKYKQLLFKGPTVFAQQINMKLICKDILSVQSKKKIIFLGSGKIYQSNWFDFIFRPK